MHISKSAGFRRNRLRGLLQSTDAAKALHQVISIGQNDSDFLTSSSHSEWHQACSRVEVKQLHHKPFKPNGEN